MATSVGYMETEGRHLYAVQSKVVAVKNRGGNGKKEIAIPD